MARKKTKKILNIAPIIIILALSLALAVLAIRFFKNSSYFKIKEVICLDQEKPLDVNKALNLKGKNIFSVDLKVISKGLKNKYPEFSEINATRKLPGRLIIKFNRRKPVAKFKLSNNYFVIDSEGMILGHSASFADKNLITISGLEIAFKDLKIGQILKSKDLSNALSLIKQINDVKALKQYRFLELNIANLNKISLFIGDIQIIMRKEDFKEKLNILSSLLAQLESGLKEISYIDLRFKDPVIKKK